MYTELSDMGGELPPMAPFAVRESNLAIGRSSGSENRGPEERPQVGPVGPVGPQLGHVGGKHIDIYQDHQDRKDYQDHKDYKDTDTDRDAVPTSSARSIGAIGAVGALGAIGKGPACSLGGPYGGPQGGPQGPATFGRGVIAPVSPMVSFGANMPLVVLVVLVLNALMMLLCAVALLSRGGRSA